MELGATVPVLVQSLLGFLDRLVTNVTGVAGGEHVLAVQMAPHVVLVPGRVKAQLAAVLAVFRAVRVSIHRICRHEIFQISGEIQMLKFILSEQLHLVILRLLAGSLVLPKGLPGLNYSAADRATVGFGGELMCLQMDSHVVLFVGDMVAEGAGEPPVFCSSSICRNHI